MTLEKLTDEISRRASYHANASKRAPPASAERAVEARLEKECRDIANFIRLSEKKRA